MNTVTTIRLTGFLDPRLDQEAWSALVARSSTEAVFLTLAWQVSWWKAFGRGELLLIAAERHGAIVALAPWFTEAGMIYLVGSGGSDYLDLLGDTSDPDVLLALLDHARRTVADFTGFVFYHLPDVSPTAGRLADAGRVLGLRTVDEGDQQAPRMDLRGEPAHALDATRKKSLVRHEKFFARDDGLQVIHSRTAEDVLPHLDEFFAQHVARWADTPSPSLFGDEAQRRFYREVASRGSRDGWLRFTRVLWHGRAVAFHFGFCFRGSYLWYKPSFDVSLARHSPGEVLLRHLLLAAIEEGAHTFDFGLGDEAFKARFSTAVPRVRNWGLYS